MTVNSLHHLYGFDLIYLHERFSGLIILFPLLVQGIRDLFWLPVEQYRKDGRIVRGLQRGAQSFTMSTAMATLELTNRFVQTIQYAAEVAFDMVSPGPSVRVKKKQRRLIRRTKPADLREGVTNAYYIVKDVCIKHIILSIL